MNQEKKLIGEIRQLLDELESLYSTKGLESIEHLRKRTGVQPAQGHTKLELWTDGGSKGNPGLGYGSYTFEDVVQSKEFYGNHLTNNESEYKALLSGLHRIIQEYGDVSRINLTVKTDSALIEGQLREEKPWKVNADNLKPLVVKAKSYLEQFAEWHIEKVPREDIVLILGH